MMKLLTRCTMPLFKKNSFQFGIVSNQHVEKDAEVLTRLIEEYAI
jgi:hypothetical protein